MRVISGKYKGKQLEGFHIDGTRPTMDRVKESLFAMIQYKIKDSICLDLFAGSGSLGIEALSNGAKECYFIDFSKEAVKALQKNLKTIQNALIYFQDYRTFLLQTKQQFDIIFLDPPYSLHYINDCLALIKERNLLKENGIIVCEYETEQLKSVFSTYKEKKYGNTYIKIYKK